MARAISLALIMREPINNLKIEQIINLVCGLFAKAGILSAFLHLWCYTNIIATHKATSLKGS